MTYFQKTYIIIYLFIIQGVNYIYIFYHFRFKQEDRSRKLSGAPRNKPRKISSNRGSINSLHSLSSSSAFLNKVILSNTKIYRIFLIKHCNFVSRENILTYFHVVGRRNRNREFSKAADGCSRRGKKGLSIGILHRSFRCHGQRIKTKACIWPRTNVCDAG